MANVLAAAGGNFAAGLPQGGLALPTLSFRGKVFRLRKDGQEQSLKTNTLDVILVDARPNTSKRFYDNPYSREEAVAPRCSSINGETPDVSNPVAASCAVCPKNVWGSKGGDSKAKACSDYKRMVVLPLTADGNYGPCVLDLAATSLRTPKDADPKEMRLREYVSMLGNYQRTPNVVVTTLSFTDDEFPCVVFNYKRDISAEEAPYIAELIQDKDVRDIVEGKGQEHEVGAISQAAQIPVAERPAPAPTPLKRAVSVAVEDDEVEVAPAPKPRAKKPAPVATVAPVAEEAPAPSAELTDDDLLNSINAILGGIDG